MKVTVYKHGKPLEMEEVFAKTLVETREHFTFENEVVTGPIKDDSFDPFEAEVDEMASLFEAYKVKFGKNAPINIKKETLLEKLNQE